MMDLSIYKEIIIWGASFPQGMVEGDATSHGRAIESLQELLEANNYWNKVIGIVDSKKELHGRERLGIGVYDPSFISYHPDALVIINTISIKAIQKAMSDMGIKNDYVVIPYYFYHGTLEHIYDNDVAYKDIIQHETELRQLYFLEDKQTQRYFDVICKIRKHNQDDLYRPDDYEGTGENLEYFCDADIAPKGDVTYIDVGAYDGNSIEPVVSFYGDRIKRIMAFEPDDKSCVKLQQYVDRKGLSAKTEIYPYALESENKTIHLSSSGLVSIVSDEGENTLEQKIFDELDTEIIGDAMVKMDIEGSELDALKGMKKLISDKEPYLAICLYHKIQDLFEIAKYLKDANPTYRLYIRGGWHLECWAVPERHFS